MVKHPKVLGISIVSSQDVEKYSLTVKGIIGGLATILVSFGIVIPMSDISPLIDTAGSLIVQIGAIVSTCITIIGLARRIYNSFKK